MLISDLQNHNKWFPPKLRGQNCIWITDAWKYKHRLSPYVRRPKQCLDDATMNRSYYFVQIPLHALTARQSNADDGGR